MQHKRNTSFSVVFRWPKRTGLAALMAALAYLLLPGVYHHLQHTSSIDVEVFAHIRHFHDAGPKLAPEVMPFSTSRLAELTHFQSQHAEDLLWSTYRPGQYFGETIACSLPAVPAVCRHSVTSTACSKNSCVVH